MTKVIAFLMKSPFFGEKNSGDYNGYVAFKNTKKIPLSKRGLWDRNISDENRKFLDDLIDIHGGITLDDPGLTEKACIIPLTVIPKNFKSYRVIGFDTAHLGDDQENCSFEWTKKQTMSLKRQIEKLLINNNG